ncbi:MAG: hypothetical protein ACI8Z1_003293 [Candidatus Azotimanducaceae bacterium]|jgi:hypothetical protein
MSRNYIIYAPSFSDNSGGVIFLHSLAHELNIRGEHALLWPMWSVRKPSLYFSLRSFVKRRRMKTNPELNTPLARRSDLTSDSIVIYPEVALGNPLGARNVVRWLLYKPGLRDPYDFGPNEMFFRVGEITDLPQVTGGAPDLLLWGVNKTYRNQNRADRKEVCYIVRKGSEKRRIPETEAPDAINIAGMTHAQINEVFNRCHTFYSYDEATMYSQYAAVAGCTSVVIPGLYSSRDEWVKKHELARYGVAYGIDDIPHAEATRQKVLALLLAHEEDGKATVENFMTLTKERFWDGTSVRRTQV